METVDTKHIALFLPSLRGGGAERVMLNLAIGFADRGYRVDLVLTKAEGAFLSEVPDNIRIVDLNSPRMALSLLPLIRYLIREKPDAMLSAMNHVNIIAVWAKSLARSQVRLVISEHNTLSDSIANPTNRREKLLPAFMRRSYPKADAIVAVSNGVADDLSEMINVPRDQIEVIYNPVVTQKMLDQSHETINHPWFGNDTPPVILAVGRLVPAKDFSTLIRAFSLVRKKHDARLLILGEGDERPKLEALIAELDLDNDVDLPGFTSNPHKYMRNAALFVVSSAWEGLSMVLIEALACDTPVISTDCRSGPREILEGGKFGTLVKVHDVEELGEAISSSIIRNKDIGLWSASKYTGPIVENAYLNLLL